MEEVTLLNLFLAIQDGRLQLEVACLSGLSCAETVPPVCRWRQVFQVFVLGRTHRSAWKLSSAAWASGVRQVTRH